MPRDDAERMLVGERLAIRPARADDAVALTRIVAEPDVARSFGRHDIARVREELLPYSIVVVDGGVAGWLGFHEETDPDYRHVSLDIGLTTPLHNRGYGREALRLVIRDYIARGHHRSRSTRPSTTRARSAPTRRWASGRSGSCVPTSAPTTARGATTC
jgi:aminoglycoside 6'-N-acetyltransferase